MRPNIFVYVALLGWIPVVLGLFAMLPGRKACVWAFLIAWLFLPEASIKLPGLTAYDKMSAACVGVLVASMIFDSGTWFKFRPKIWDLPMLIWSICPIFSSDSNGLGFYDGFGAAAYQTFDWGLPYLIGRVYFSDLPGLRELAKGFIIGGLLYVPLCLYEIRMSPQLHLMVYGYHQYEFGQSKRGSTYRPMVFMQTGLAVGMWMASCALIAFWVWRSKLFERIAGMPMGFVAFVLFATAVGCRSRGAIALMGGGMIVLLLTYWTRLPIWLLALVLVPPAYMWARATNYWDGQDLVKRLMITDVTSGQSMAVRFQSERVIVDHALKRPWFGWAGWDRFRAKDEEGKDVGVPDGMWIIALGHNGMVGLVSFTTALLLPVLLLIWRIPSRLWQHPGAAPAAALAVICALYMCDCLFNAMPNPLFVMAAGGICGLSVKIRDSMPASTPTRFAIPSRTLPGPAPAGA